LVWMRVKYLFMIFFLQFEKSCDLQIVPKIFIVKKKTIVTPQMFSEICNEDLIVFSRCRHLIK